MASILILSKSGDGVPIALKLAEEGHIVKMWFKLAKAKVSLEGYKNPSRVSDPRRMLEQYDLVLCDMVGLGSLCNELADKGKLVLGGGLFNDKIELDREYGEKVISLTKAKVPATVTCSNTTQLIDHLQTVGSPQVIKPLGNKEVSLTLVSKDPANRALVSLARQLGDKLVPCIVQERIDGIEISTEGWFNGGWVRPFNHTMEKKRFMEGDKGPNTGCMGNVVWATNGDKLTATVLEPLEPLLERVGYVGPLDVNCIVTQDAAYFLEFTARFGYDAIQAWNELLKLPLFDYLYKVATKQADEVPVFQDSYSIAIRLSVPPYPSEKGTEQWAGVQVLDVPKEASKHVWLADVMRKDGVDVVAGVDGVLGCVTARGSSVRECRRRAYRTINNIVIHPDVQYRSDIGADTEENIAKLKEWGWLN
jgi:phosphoribosylamine--glycine ligase